MNNTNNSDTWRLNAIRITKYDPKFRYSNSIYSKKEWTSYGDIGKVFNGDLFTLEEYINTEEKYIQAAKSFFIFFDCTSFTVKNVEKYHNTREFLPNDLHLFENYLKIKNRSSFSINEIDTIIQLILRNYLWCELFGNSFKSVVRFGYDYYMYFSFSAKKKDITPLYNIIKKIGLFWE